MLQFIRVRHLLVVVGVLFAMGSAYQAMHTTQGVMSVKQGEATLASAPYRAPIVEVETRLFAPGPLSMEERVRLAESIDAMREALLRGEDQHMTRYSAGELATLAAMARGLGNLGGDDLERVRRNWMRIRANTFDDASWYRFSESDPPAPIEEPRLVLSARDRALAEGLRAALADIEAQIADGEREVERLGEPQPSGAVDESVGAAWRDWLPTWEARLARLRRTVPETSDPATSQRVRFAGESAIRAIEELAAMPGAAATGGRPPYEVERTRHLQNARRAVAAARDWLAKAIDGRTV